MKVRKKGDFKEHMSGLSPLRALLFCPSIRLVRTQLVFLGGFLASKTNRYVCSAPDDFNPTYLLKTGAKKAGIAPINSTGAGVRRFTFPMQPPGGSLKCDV